MQIFFEKKNMFYNIKKNLKNTCTIKKYVLSLQCNQKTNITN